MCGKGSVMVIRLEAQLDGSRTEGVDCGVASTVMAIDYASHGKIRTTTERVRNKMGTQDPTNPWDWQRAIRGFRDAARKQGLRPIRSNLASGADFERLRTLLFERKRPVIIALDYGTIADKSRRHWSSTTFRGAHAVLLRKGAERGGRLRVKVFDPLADGRIVGGRRMAKGPNWWDWSVVKEAAANVRDGDGKLVFPGRDRWIGLVIWRTVPIVKDKPDPVEEPPLDDDEVEPDDPDDAIDALTDVASDLDDVIDELTTAADRKRVAAAVKALKTARQTIEPFLPPASDSTSDSKAGIRDRGRDDK
jgi:hypothetical protein